MSITHLRPTVRVAGPADEQEVYRLLLLAHAEVGLMQASNEKVSYYVKRFLWGAYLHPLDDGPRGVIGVIGDQGKPLEALAMLLIGSFWYSNDKHLEELIVYVDPNFRRGSGHLRSLSEWMKKQNQSTGLPILTGIMVNHRTEAKCKLYRRMYTKIGEYFIIGDNHRFVSDDLTGQGSVLKSSMAA